MTVFKFSFGISYIQRMWIAFKLYHFSSYICMIYFSIFTYFSIVYFPRKICSLSYLPRPVIWPVVRFIHFCKSFSLRLNAKTIKSLQTKGNVVMTRFYPISVFQKMVYGTSKCLQFSLDYRASGVYLLDWYPIRSRSSNVLRHLIYYDVK